MKFTLPESAQFAISGKIMLILTDFNGSLSWINESGNLYPYMLALFGPFVQEDAAVLAAATLSATHIAPTLPMFILVTLGLFFSDIWKYWIGYAAIHHEKFRKFAEKKHVSDLQNQVYQHTLITLLTARFVPLTRIPTYIACGFFQISYLKFCIYIALTALLYSTVIFIIVHLLGVALGERVLWALPIIALSGLFLFLAYHWFKNKHK